MIPDLPPNPRAELESRITAWLLGELSSDEAATVRQQVENDPELSKLRDRLSQTLNLLRETVATPMGETAASPTPMKLSAARREKLLAQFKTIRPVEFEKPKRGRPDLILALAAVASIAILAALMLPALSKAKQKGQRFASSPQLFDNLTQSAAPAASAPLSQAPDQVTDNGSATSSSADNAKVLAVLEARRRAEDTPAVKTMIPPPAPQDVSASPQVEAELERESKTRRLAENAPVAAPTSAGRIVLPQSSSDEPAAQVASLNRDGSVETGFKNQSATEKGFAFESSSFEQVQKDSQKLFSNAGVAQSESMMPNGTFHLGEPNSRPEDKGVALNYGPVSGIALEAGTFDANKMPPVVTTAPAPVGISGTRTFDDSFSTVNGNANSAGGTITATKSIPNSSDVVVNFDTKKEEPVTRFYSLSGGDQPAQKDSDKLGWTGAPIHSPPLLGDVPATGSLVASVPMESMKAPAPAHGGEQMLRKKLDSTDREKTFGGGGGVGGNNSYAYSATNAVVAFASAAPAGIPEATIPINHAKAEDISGALRTLDAPLPRPSLPPPVPQPEVLTSVNAFTTFSLNISDVAFKLTEASLQNGQIPDAASLRSEEFINAFDYRDPEPAPGAPIGFAWERAGDPFTHNRDFLRFSVKTAAQGRQAGRPLNIVLLLDKSGSMERADRVEIISRALKVLASQLQPNDTLSIVIFARTARLFADGVPGSQAGSLASELRSIQPEGGTNLEEAMRLAYQTALRHYLANGENRVVLLTDGAANLGSVEPTQLKRSVENNRKQGIALDCFGVGWDGYNDPLLETLSRAGNGRYGFINTPEEAATEFAGKLAGALRVAAADVKVQVEFNPDRVAAYRQIGYAKDQLKKEDFRDNSVKAAQIGAAESGNALYTIQLKPSGDGPIGTVHVRYRVPGTENYEEHEWVVPYTGSAVPLDKASPAVRLAATAAEFSEWLAGNQYAAGVTPDLLLNYLRGVPQVYGADGRPGKLEWMIRQAKSITGK